MRNVPTIQKLEVRDIRFPTSRLLDGSDAMNPDPDYSAAYVILHTDSGESGHGLTFTIGRGQEVVIAAVKALEPLLIAHERTDPQEAHVLLWHLERARALIAPLEPRARAGIVVHGDFTPWNLLFQDGKLSGILDFELARRDHRIADFAQRHRK